VEFHFFPLGAIGIAYEELARVLRVSLPQSTVFRQLPFDNYLEKLSKCEFILCPFPYGNTNSIVDAVMVGLPGICLDGPEPHSHIDVGLFQRMGLPDQLSAKTIDDYVGQAVKMIDDEEWRVACRSIAFNCDLDKTFYDDNSSAFCDAITKLVWPKGAPTSA
jgi:predicted O-linked N-acetylglucosamine transferase (SPINDLY family)